MISSLFEFFRAKKSSRIFIVKDSYEAQRAADVATYYDKKSIIFPDFRAYNGDDLRSYTIEYYELLVALDKFYTTKTIAFIPIRTLLHYLPKKEYIKKYRLEFGQKVEFDAFKKLLINYGYTFVDVVESFGEVSFRGDIFDIFPVGYERPIRVSFFDDEIESIREFELETQKSIKEELEEFSFLPAFLSINDEEYSQLLELVEEYESDSFMKDLSSIGFWVAQNFCETIIENGNTLFTSDLSIEIDEIYSFGKIQLSREALSNIPQIAEAVEYKEIKEFNPKELIEFHEDKKITLIAKNDAILKQNAIPIDTNLKIINKDIVLNLISKEHLIISLNKKVRDVKKIKKSIILDELKPNDFVVHKDYGVGIFKAIEPATVLGATNDYIVVHYLGDDRLLIPAQNLEVIDRYVANSGSIPVLDKLGKGSFVKNRDKIKTKLLEIASSIVALAAKRELIRGIKIDVKTPEIDIFRATAGFDYTADQKRSIEEIFFDLGSSHVMDRLLSGDVGFGKTEVAMNAIFVVAKSGYQSMFVAPTTLLSNQHYKSLQKRFMSFGIKVARLDRFVSAKEKKSILKALEDGDIDVVVGTHSLLGAKFKNLALVIVDEEHKFGVKQKEALKEISHNVHLLSMSATPIPRTLNMALSTIKGMSQLLTAPMDRIGVRTYVKEYNDSILKEVVLREIRRGGQIFYVFNSIAAIENKKSEILKILPQISIAILHSQVNSNETEDIMLDFENGKYNMLLSTSIIESGIHLPNANTIIIDGANNFGIADLHQLRGRVGRGSKEGYCYFFVDDKDTLTPEATKRLLALENNSNLGSGYALAYQDLEIRGGGNILGENQSGHIKNIGYGLYLRMLEESINELSGKISEKKADVDIKLAISAFISTELIAEDRVRLEIYRRLSKCEEVGQVYEIEEEIIDRFGKPDQYTKQFLDIIVMKILSSNIGIKSITSFEQNINITFEDGSKELIKSNSKDEDDIVEGVLKYLREKSKAS